MLEDKAQILESVAPFSLLDDSLREKIAAEAEIKEYARGTYVFRQGTPSLNALFVILEGLAEVTVKSQTGSESVVGYRHQHDFFGETVLLTDEEYPGSVRANTDLRCLVIPQKAVESLLYHNPEVASYFSRVLLSRMRRLYQEIITEQPPGITLRGESVLFRRRAAEIMSTPAITCHPDDNICKIAQQMVEYDISAVVVVDRTNKPLGIVTENDLVKRLAQQENKWSLLTAEMLMNKDIVEVPVTAYLHQVLVQIIKFGVKHVVVTESGLLAGIISAFDLARARSAGTLSVAYRIETQQTIAGLKEASLEIDGFLNALVAEKTPVRDILAIVSELHDAFTRRVVQLVEEEVEKERGAKPVDYCLILMGSAGRREQTIRTDQDIAIIFDDPDGGDESKTAAYFQYLGGRISDTLAECGFEKCQFGIMPSNREWCRSISEWQEHVMRLTLRVNPEDVRVLTVLLDFRPVYGNYKMARNLWYAVFRSFDEVSSGALHLVADSNAQIKPPLSLFGQILTEKSGPHKNHINLKTAACIHIVNIVRILALKHKITETSTLERLRLLREAKAITPDDAEFVEAAYETLLMFRIRENLKKLRQGGKPDNYIKPRDLSKREQEVLKSALAVISRLKNITTNEFGEFWRLYLPS